MSRQVILGKGPIGSTLAGEVLGWRPERSTLPQMIGDAWRWHQTGGYDG